MNEYDLIRDLAVLWTISLLSGLFCLRLKLPVIVGYMLAGVLVGPHALKLIDQPEQIRLLSEFGVAMLLFVLGVDLSLKKVLSSAKRIVTCGLVQMISTIAFAWFIAAKTGLVTNAAAGLVFGCICAISSSVVISRVLVDRGEQDSIHGQILIPLSLVQDLCLVAIIPFFPVLERASMDLSGVLISAAKAGLFMLAVVWGSTKIVPSILARAAKTNSREIFLLTLLVLCLGIAILSKMLGLSIALGAFIAGIMICESSYAHQALHDLSPLRDVFSSIFFISVGLLLDPNFIVQHWLQVLIFLFALIIGKSILGTLAALFATKNLRSAVLVGVGLAQIGEFSFVLMTLGHDSKLISDSIYNLFFAGSIMTMIANPALMAVLPKLMLRLPSGEASKGHEPVADSNTSLSDHVIVCGYGRIGRNLGLILEAQQIPFIVVELNASIVEELAMTGIKHIYGDAMSANVLRKAHIRKAKAIVLTVPDPLSGKFIANFARKWNPDIKIIARAHRTDDIRIFREAGANAVVQPEFEASIEITRLVLHSINCPMADIARALAEMRTRRYAIFQPDISEIELFAHPQQADDVMGIWFKVDSNSVDGKSIRNLNIREQTGATVTAIKRGSETFSFPDPDFELKTNDEIYAVGASEHLEKFASIFQLLQGKSMLAQEP